MMQPAQKVTDSDRQGEEINNEEKESVENSRSESGISDDVGMVIGNISTKLASVFNRLIYTISTVRNTIEKQEKEEKKRRKGETIDLIKLQEEEDIQKKEIKKLKRKFKSYEMEYQENRPKKPVSSFFIFYQEKLKELGPKSGDVNGPKISQIASEAWKAMTTEQRRPYLQKANETKAKYVEEMRQYIEEHADEIEQFKQQKREAMAKIRQKKRTFQDFDQGPEELDQRFLNRKLKGISMRQMKIQQRKEYSHRPKAPVSSFFIYYQQEAKNIADKYCISEGKKLSKLASDLWKKMPEQERKPYDIKALAEREKYHEEMRQYRINYPDEVQARKNKISASMRRSFQKKNNENQSDSDDSDEIPSSEFDQSRSYESVRSKGEEGGSQKQLQQMPNKSGLSIQKLQNPEKPKVPDRKENNNITPNKPRGTVCGFFQFYQKNMRQFFSPEKGHNLGSDLVKRASQKWKSMSSEQKKPYNMMYRIDRQRFLREMEEYKIKHPEEYEIYLKLNSKTKHNSKDEDKSNELSPLVEKVDSGGEIQEGKIDLSLQKPHCSENQKIVAEKQAES